MIQGSGSVVGADESDQMSDSGVGFRVRIMDAYYGFGSDGSNTEPQGVPEALDRFLR